VTGAYRKLMVGYRDDEHGEDALALARALASSEAVRDVLVVEASGARQSVAGQGWPAHVKTAVRALPDGSPADALPAVAAEEDVDLLVLGSTHRGLAGRVLRGTTAGHILRDASLPMAIAPGRYRDAPGRLRRIGVAYDGSDEAGIALEWASAAARPLAAEIRLLAVVEPPPPPVETWGASVPGEAWADGLPFAESSQLTQTLREDMDHRLEAARRSSGQPDAEVVSVVGDPLLELRSAAEDVDLLVVGSHGDGAFSRLLAGSVSRGLVHSCPSPLVVVQDRSAPSSS
jgi:nucleotide-binding universal stress UspA family protein